MYSLDFWFSKRKSTYSIAILIFDIIEVADVSDEYVKELIQIILSWQNPQIRGQFITSANAFSLIIRIKGGLN